MKEALPYLTLFVACCALAYSIFKDRSRGYEEKFQKWDEGLTRLAVLEALWKFLESKVLEVLHHPNRHHLDSLLDARRSNTLSPEQRDELLAVLDSLKSDPDEGWAATMLMVSLQAERLEAELASGQSRSWWDRIWR